MIALRPGASRGITRSAGTLVRHSFSFGDYYDPAHMGFGPLRVINEIELGPGATIDAEPRANIELLSWVLAGALRGGSVDPGGVLREHELACLSAGEGFTSGAANASGESATRVLQVWLQPDCVNAQPRFSRTAATGHEGVLLLASADGRDGSSAIRQDVDVFSVRLRAGQCASHALRLDRRAWLQSTAGSMAINGVRAVAGDGVIALNENRIEFVAHDDAELLLFDVRAH